MKKIKTKKDYENFLNELGVPENEGRPKTNVKYGSWLRKNDPIAFQCGYNDYK